MFKLLILHFFPFSCQFSLQAPSVYLSVCHFLNVRPSFRHLQNYSYAHVIQLVEVQFTGKCS
jgi:hypothetical protein